MRRFLLMFPSHAMLQTWTLMLSRPRARRLAAISRRALLSDLDIRSAQI